MVNKCHTKRDTTGGYATLDLRLPARMTNKGRHCPAHIIIIGRAIQLLNRPA
ncbi:hypothetical protein [Candidatus Spongiihabitans sp.]|uniref:hypothetical protein n=1 Tax=Candidatus Spongiihabitans sp. TaxID=3101308 RepID=UPI003C7ED27A